MDSRVEPLTLARVGTCIPLPHGSGVYAVRGRTGWFRANLATMRCDCACSLHARRMGIEMTPCAHLRDLARHVAHERQKAQNAVSGLPCDAWILEKHS